MSEDFKPFVAKVVATNELRLKLLAVKYSRSSFNTEDQARLDILNERMRNALVRVEENDVVALENTAADVERSRELRKRLAGIRA